MSGYLDRLFALDGKTAVVIGGGGYLCGAMADGLAAAGVRVTIADLRLEKAEAAVARIAEAGGEARPATLDATDKAAQARVLADAEAAYGGVDILINGAGINAPTPPLEIEYDAWRAIIDSHMTATLYGCQVFGAHMLAQGSGSIVNLSSASAGPPLSKAFAYSAAKAGVLNLTQNFAREWAPRGVRVNALRPGFFPTDWSREHFIDPAREQAILGHTPMARYGRPEELIGAVLWLASSASGFVTGAQIAVDGGFTAMTI